jgi:cell pole-organizing protein PopZ
MEEILASIRRIIADEDTGKAARPEPTPGPKTSHVTPPGATPSPPPAAVASRPAPKPVPPAPVNNQHDIDAMLADIDARPKAPEAPPAQAAPVFVPPPPAPDVLDLTEAMAAPGPVEKPSAGFRTIDAASDVVFTEGGADAPAQSPRARDEANRRAPPGGPSDYQALISNQTMSAVDSAFNSLAHTVLGNNARTLEDLVKEMLRPMLKGWLDDNLPNLVERIVRAEIERVSRGRS